MVDKTGEIPFLFRIDGKVYFSFPNSIAQAVVFLSQLFRCPLLNNAGIFTDIGARRDLLSGKYPISHLAIDIPDRNGWMEPLPNLFIKIDPHPNLFWRDFILPFRF